MITRGELASARSIRERLEGIRSQANAIRIGVIDRSLGPSVVESGVYEIHTTTFAHAADYLGTDADLALDRWFVVNSNGTTGGGQSTETVLTRAFDLSIEPVAIRAEWAIDVRRIENDGTYPDPFDYEMGVVFQLQVFTGSWEDVPGARYFVQAMHDPSSAPRRAISGRKVCSGVHYVTGSVNPGSVSKVRMMMSIFAKDTTGDNGPHMSAKFGGVSFTVDVMKIG